MPGGDVQRRNNVLHPSLYLTAIETGFIALQNALLFFSAVVIRRNPYKCGLYKIQCSQTFSI